MSFLSEQGGDLGEILNISTVDVEQKRKLLAAYLAKGAVQNAANLGLKDGEAAGIMQRGKDLQRNPVATDPTAANAYDPTLAAAKAHYLQQFQDGGPMGQAAIHAAQQASGLTAEGGAVGVRKGILGSADRIGGVAQVAEGERNAAGQTVNNLDANSAAAKLRQAVMAAQVTHANLVAGMNVQGNAFDLGNSQSVLNTAADTALNSADYHMQMTDLQQEKQQAEVGKQILGMLTSALTKGLGTGTSAFSSTAAAPAVDYTAGTLPTQTATPGVASGTAGYLQSMSPRVSVYNTPSPLASASSAWSPRSAL